MSRRVLLTTVLLGGLMCATLPAAPIFGSFNIAGTLTVTPTMFLWQLNDAPFTAEKSTIGPADTGSFVPLAGSTVTIHNLNAATAPVGVNIAPSVPFIAFDSPLAVAAGFPTLNLNMIFAGIYGTGQCLALPATVGQTCTPSAPVTAGTSPFNLVNNPPPAPVGPQATITFAMGGVTSDGLETWVGNFTSQFTQPYQSILAQLSSTGSVTNTFSATFTLAPVVPEAGTMSLLGLGLVAFSIKLRRRKS